MSDPSGVAAPVPLGTVAAMQGGGFYNRNSSLQAANLTSALPLLQAAASQVGAQAGRTVCIADYGVSQGRNSMMPMGTAIDEIRKQCGEACAISVAHVDLPSNDFASLFALLDQQSDSYLNGRDAIYPFAVGRSHFEQVLPDESVDLGWSANAIHWMSANPVLVADHGWGIFSQSADNRAKVDDLLARDWLNFLKARAREMRSGAKLVCQFMARGEDRHGFEYIADAFWASVQDIAGDGQLADDALLAMTAPSAGRSANQIRAPFDNGHVDELALSDMAIVEAPDPMYAAYLDDRDAQKFGRTWAELMRAANGPSFALGIREEGRRDEVIAAIHDRLAQRLAGDPQPAASYNVLLAVEKR